MHREPLPRDIIRVPGSDAPERVVNVTDDTLTLAPLRGDETRTIERPARRRIALVGVASTPTRKRRANVAQQPGRPTEVAPPGEPLCASCGGPVELARHCYAIPTCYDCLPPPEPGSGGVDPSDLF